GSLALKPKSTLDDTIRQAVGDQGQFHRFSGAAHRQGLVEAFTPEPIEHTILPSKVGQAVGELKFDLHGAFPSCVFLFALGGELVVDLTVELVSFHPGQAFQQGSVKPRAGRLGEVCQGLQGEDDVLFCGAEGREVGRGHGWSSLSDRVALVVTRSAQDAPQSNARPVAKRDFEPKLQVRRRIDPATVQSSLTLAGCGHVPSAA
ncbi:hypothetical protein LTR94_029056, partial [Friedmanniomyces endolithicus]